VGVSCCAYGIALFSTAIGGFWTGPDFDHPPMPGWNCLLSGWWHFPEGWLANPLMFMALFLLMIRFRIAAFLTSSAAVGLAWIWTENFSREFSVELLRSGYDWWMGSLHVLAFGILCSAVWYYRESWQSVKSFCRASRESLV